MKKRTVFAAALALLVAGGVFAQEYTIYLAGDNQGTITVKKEGSGKITITQNITQGGWRIDKTICPILPAESAFDISDYTKSIVIDGKTTTITATSGVVYKIVVDGNTSTITFTKPKYTYKSIIDGNTLTGTSSDGSWTKEVLSGNTLTRTSSDGSWERLVVTGNTVTETNSKGEMIKATINGNTTTGEGSYYVSWKEVISGNTRTFTGNGVEQYREVVDGNTITKTTQDGNFKMVVEKQGYNIFITVTDQYYNKWNTRTYGPRTISEKDRIQHIIDVVTSGRMTHEDLFGQIFNVNYGR